MLTKAELIHHMETEHGWPSSRLHRLQLDSTCSHEVGPPVLRTKRELQAKHDFDHSAGYKFTAATEHVHRSGQVAAG